MSSEMEIGDLKPASPTPSEARPQQFTAVNNNSNNNTNDSQRPSTDGPATNGNTNGNAQALPSTPSQPPVAPARSSTSVFGGPSSGPSATPTQSRPIIYSTGNGNSNSNNQALNTTSASSVRTNNGHLPHDRSPSNSPHVPPASTPANDAWHSTEDAPDSANGQLKRKRSITPTTQTQHHHLAAHEAAMGAASMPSQHQTPQQRSGDDAMSGADEDGRSVRDVTLEDGSPHPQGIHIDPHTGIRVDPKRRKRVFSNRTKTGCITCRRRKKKCDEGKPECTNCKRGGFVCEGYSGKVSWQKPPGKQLPPTVVTGPPYIVSKEDIPGAGSPTPGHPHSLPASTPTSSHRIGMDDRPYHPRPTAAAEISVPPPSQDSTSPQGTQSFLPLRGETSQPTSAAATTAAAPHDNVPASAGGAAGADRRVSFSHQALAAATGSMVRPRSEKEKMINSELYHANSSELIAEREACKAACWRYNNVASNPNLGISEAEKGRLLLDIIRPGNKWEVVNTGAAPGTPGGLTYVSENGFTSDIIDVTVDAPFTCSYGYNIRLGKNVYIEFGCTILDSCAVTIKARTILSPGVSIYSATHPIDPRKRNGSRGPEMAKPVLIEEDCWLGGNVIVLGGITIGKGSVVGAGSVVTRDVPPFTVVAGNPARVIRGIYQNGVDM